MLVVQSHSDEARLHDKHGNAPELLPQPAPALACREDHSLFLSPLVVIKKQAAQRTTLRLRAERVIEVVQFVIRPDACFERQDSTEARLQKRVSARVRATQRPLAYRPRSLVGSEVRGLQLRNDALVTIILQVWIKDVAAAVGKARPKRYAAQTLAHAGGLTARKMYRTRET